jgi:putative ABC transport system ATP-binding protein
MPNATSSADALWISVRDLRRVYRRGQGEVRALDGVSLDFARGSFTALVGASGSGKSTLLNLVGGLDTPTSGTVTVGGVDLGALGRRGLSRYRATRVGMIFQSFHLVPHLSALGNVETALWFDGTPPADRRRRAAEMLERLGLGDRLEHRPAALSGGEQQRVAVARALVKEPEILLADEPTGNLDRDNAARIAELLGGLAGNGLTLLLATHDLELAAARADRTIRLEYGRLTGDEPPRPDPRPAAAGAPA